MSKQGVFLVYCVERYRQIKNLSGKEVVDLFKKYAVMQFIMDFYEPLHITGDLHIAQEIDEYIEEKVQEVS